MFPRWWWAKFGVRGRQEMQKRCDQGFQRLSHHQLRVPGRSNRNACFSLVDYILVYVYLLKDAAGFLDEAISRCLEVPVRS